MGVAFIIIQNIELVRCYLSFIIISFILMIPFWFKHKLLNGSNNPFVCFIESIFLLFWPALLLTYLCNIVQIT